MHESWNDILKELTDRLAEHIPVLGSVVAFLIYLFWPPSEKDIWEKIKDEVAHLIDQKILAKELEDRKEQLKGLRDTMSMYTKAKPHEKGALMATMLNQANTLNAQLTESSNRIHLVPLSVVLSHLHLALLRERLTHGAEMYDEDNTPVWQQELQDKYQAYHKFFRDVYLEWKAWRDEQVTVSCYTTQNVAPFPPFFTYTAHGDVMDKVTTETIKYQANLNSNAETFRGVCNAIAERMKNQAIGGMAATLSSTFLLHIYLPGKEKATADVDPNLSTLWLGPFSPATFGLHDRGEYTPEVEDKPGHIVQVYVREWNSIDGLQFIYSDHKGNFIGDPKGGQAHNIEVGSGRHVTGLGLRFAHGIICRVEITFSDGTSTGPLGNRSDWRGPDVNAVVDSAYELVSGAFRKGNGPSKTKGTKLIKLKFQHSSLVRHLS